jgi:hypothetical protein
VLLANLYHLLIHYAHPSPLRVGLRPLACWDCGFESRRKPGCRSLVSVVCCQVEVSATGRPTERGAYECDRETWKMRRPWPDRACCAMGGGEVDSLYQYYA